LLDVVEMGGEKRMRFGSRWWTTMTALPYSEMMPVYICTVKRPWPPVTYCCLDYQVNTDMCIVLPRVSSSALHTSANRVCR